MAMIDSGNDHLAVERTGSSVSRALPGGRLSLRRALTLAVFVAAVGAAFAFAWGYIRFAAGIEAREPVAAPRTDAIVVVTGGSQRVGDAIGLLGADRGARLLISGVNEKTSR